MTDRPSNAGVAPNAKAETEAGLEPKSKPGPKPKPESKPEPTPESDLPPETEASEAAENDARPPDDNDEDIAQLRRRYLLRRFWHTAFRFWTTAGCRVAWLLSAALLAVILLNLAAAYAMNLWHRSIFDALEKKDANTVLALSLIYFAILAVSVSFSIALVYTRMTTQRRWRKWLTDTLVSRWLKSGRYYQLNLVSGDHENPEYRIAEDVRIAADAPVDFVSGVTSAFLSAATFIVVLWTIGGALSFSVGGVDVTIPGFLVIAAVIYALLASGAMLLIGRRFVTVSEGKNQSEAELRYVLTRLRENGESIALIQGEEEERAGVARALAKVLCPASSPRCCRSCFARRSICKARCRWAR
jgi:putative ATP-binding cassette transporter